MATLLVVLPSIADRCESDDVLGNVVGGGLPVARSTTSAETGSPDFSLTTPASPSREMLVASSLITCTSTRAFGSIGWMHDMASPQR